MSNPHSKTNVGVRFGLLTGLIYVLLLFLRYYLSSSNPIFIGVLAVISYLIILMLFLFTGMARRKELGGYGEIREIFQSIFIAILITELCYVIFNLIYFKYIDPAFWEKFRAASLTFMEKAGMAQHEIDERMKSLKDLGQQTNPMGLIKGFGTSVVMDSIFGLIFAALLRKKRPLIT